jgi:hypothetical protein
MKVSKLVFIALFVLCITVMPCFAEKLQEATSDVLPKIGTRVAGAECWGVIKNGSDVVVAEVNIIVNGMPRTVRHSVTANEPNQLNYLSDVPPIKGWKHITTSIAFDTRLSIGIRGKLVPRSFRQVIKLNPGDEGRSCRIQFAQIIEGKKVVTEIPLQGFAKYTEFNGKQRETIIWLNAPTGKVEWTKLRKDEVRKKTDPKHPVH